MKTNLKTYIIILGLLGLVIGKSGVSNVSPRVTETSTANMPDQSVININNIAYWMKKSSAGTTSGSNNGTQADYPIGTGGLIYEDGMLWGVKVTDGNSQSPRVGGTTYYSGLKAGRVVYDASGDVCGSTDPADAAEGTITKANPKTANILADNGDNKRVPYAKLTLI